MLELRALDGAVGDVTRAHNLDPGGLIRITTNALSRELWGKRDLAAANHITLKKRGGRFTAPQVPKGGICSRDTAKSQ